MAKLIMELEWPFTVVNTTAVFTQILREQADRLDKCVWSLGPKDRIPIRHPITHEVIGHFRFDEDQQEEKPDGEAQA